MVVKFGEPEVFVREVAQAGKSVVDADSAGLKRLEQVSEPGFVDGAYLRESGEWACSL